jgi:hypothetical protein
MGEETMKAKFLALMIVGGAAFLPTQASAQLCAGAVIISALIVSATQDRPLTANEAATCGLIIEKQPAKPAAAKRTKVAKKKAG